jgi:hypothetical protein
MRKPKATGLRFLREATDDLPKDPKTSSYGSAQFKRATTQNTRQAWIGELVMFAVCRFPL